MNLNLSLAGRLAILCSLLLAFLAAIGALLSEALDPWWLAWLIALLATLPLLWIGISKIIAPITQIIQALTDGADSLKDNDFSVSIAQRRNDELGALIAAHNKLGGALREERQTLFQRELLLDTVIQSTDTSLVLTNVYDRVVYSNAAARQMFNSGRAINGHLFASLIDARPRAYSDAVSAGKNGLFTLEGDEPKTYHLSQNTFTLNTQPHRLYLFKHLTQELGRQEVATWKNVIRVISHELNNSLAPISSLAHSGKKVLARKDHAEQLRIVFDTIEDRASHLKQFIESYARFARLPSPQLENVHWPDFMSRLSNAVEFNLVEPVPDISCQVDPVQFEQVMINLIKNAKESGSPVEDIRVAVTLRDFNTLFTVTDRGGGIPEEVMRNALLPFYSTKKSGTGLGLPLCREIIEAHGGALSLSNIHSHGLQVRISIPNS